MDVKITVEKMKLAMSCSSYNELAERLNISLGAIDSWKIRKNIPNRYLMQVCDVTGVSLDWLISEDKPTFTITGGTNPISQNNGMVNNNVESNTKLKRIQMYEKLEQLATLSKLPNEGDKLLDKKLEEIKTSLLGLI